MKPEPNGNEKMLTCDGSCEEHVGMLRHVYVRHLPSNTDWGVFTYCENAVAEDIRRGLHVTEIAATNVK